MAPGVVRVVASSRPDEALHALAANASHAPGPFSLLKLCDVVHVGRIHGAARRIEHLRVAVAKQDFAAKAERVQKLVLDGAGRGAAALVVGVKVEVVTHAFLPLTEGIAEVDRGSADHWHQIAAGPSLNERAGCVGVLIDGATGVRAGLALVNGARRTLVAHDVLTVEPVPAGGLMQGSQAARRWAVEVECRAAWGSAGACSGRNAHMNTQRVGANKIQLFQQLLGCCANEPAPGLANGLAGVVAIGGAGGGVEQAALLQLLVLVVVQLNGQRSAILGA